MVIDGTRYFEYVSREYVEFLRRSARRGYAETVARLLETLPALWVRVYRLHCPLEPVVDQLTHEPYEFLYDSAATKTGNPELEDRVVVAYGRAQQPPDLYKVIDEMEAGLAAGETIPSAAEVFRFVIEHHCHAVTRRRKAELDRAVASALGAGVVQNGATGELLRRLSGRASPPLTKGILGRIRLAVLPLLEADSWPRMISSSRQYSALRGMLGMDVGHFIAHATCGTFNINTFPQDRALNRGRSVSGRKYRMMERYAAGHPGTFYFSRPVYSGPSWVPEYLEWGALVRLKERSQLPVVDGENRRLAIGDVGLLPAGRRYGWWIGVFRNRPSFRSDLCSGGDFQRAIEIAEQVPLRVRRLLSTKVSLRRTRRAHGIEAHYSGLEEVERRLAELSELVEGVRRRLDDRVARGRQSGRTPSDAGSPVASPRDSKS